MLEIQALSFKQPSYTLFENLHFHAKPGSLIQIMGKNGTGKTTLLRILAGFLAPSSGKIGYYPLIEKENNLCRNVTAYLGHNNALKPGLTIIENIFSHANLMGINHTKINPNALLEKAKTLLNRFNLTPYSENFVYTLSAGQQRKLGLINVFLSQRPIWLLDEPLAALDEGGQEQFQIQLTAHLETGGVAIIATHQAFQINTHAIQILVL